MPAQPVVFTRRATQQVESAALWWRLNRPAASDALLADLAAALVLIVDQPACGILVPSRRFRGLRRIQLGRVGYHLYYRVAPRQRQIQVVAFWQARRGTPPPL